MSRGPQSAEPAGATGSPAGRDPAARAVAPGAAPPQRLHPRPIPREQRTTVIYGMLCFVLILVVLQLWLLTATMNAYLGGDESVIWPAAGASVLCLLLNLGLLRYLYAIERH